MLKTSSLKFPGFYRAKVLDNEDDSKLGRLKVQVFGIFAEADSDYLPWAVPAQPLFFGAGSGYGHLAIPAIGSYVWVFFENQDFTQPVYFAEATDGVHGLPDDRETNYPDRFSLTTPGGITFYIDDSNDELKLTHPSGAYFTIDTNGNVTVFGTTINLNT